MIWPNRNFVVAAVVPTILSLFLLIDQTQGLRPALLAVDGAIVLVALADLAGTAFVKGLTASRAVGGTASLGEKQKVTVTIKNLSRRRRVLHIRDDVPDEFVAEPNVFVASIPPLGTVELEYTVAPRRRGAYRFRRVYVMASSRLGFWKKARRLKAESTVRVYPDVRQIARYTILARRDKLNILGVRRSRRLGTDNEFERLRDYNEGDEPRHIDWRATARRRKTTVRAHQSNQSQRVIFLIDCGRMMAGDTGGGLSPFDHALNTMLMLAHVALVRGDQVGLMTYGERILSYLPPAAGRRQTNRLVHSVHDVFPELVESRHDRAFVELDRRCRKRSLVILITNVFDEVNADQIVDHLCNLVGRHLPLAVLLRDRDVFSMADAALDDDSNLFAGAAAASMLNWRERVLAQIRSRGALTLDVFPEEITAPLVNRYLEIKARHLL